VIAESGGDQAGWMDNRMDGQQDGRIKRGEALPWSI
jgi:hypothetical protein